MRSMTEGLSVSRTASIKSAPKAEDRDTRYATTASGAFKTVLHASDDPDLHDGETLFDFVIETERTECRALLQSFQTLHISINLTEGKIVQLCTIQIKSRTVSSSSDIFLSPKK